MKLKNKITNGLAGLVLATGINGCATIPSVYTCGHDLSVPMKHAGSADEAKEICRSSTNRINVHTHYNTGQLAMLFSCKKGKEEGPHSVWYRGGQVMYRIEYSKGKLDGMWRGWYANGNPEKEMAYVDNQLHGTSRIWHPNGITSVDFERYRGELVSVKCHNERKMNQHDHGWKSEEAEEYFKLLCERARLTNN